MGMRSMSGAADKECVKLDATFFNNIAVGTALGGIFLPLYALSQSDLMVKWSHGQFNEALDFPRIVSLFIGMVWTFAICIWCRAHAWTKLSELQD